MNRRLIAPAVKFGVFTLVMLLVSAGLVVVFGQLRSGSTDDYKAVFTDVSGLSAGDSVRVAGIRVGTVNSVQIGKSDHRARVSFDASTEVPLTDGTRAQVRYLNLVGDRYLELSEGPGGIARLPKGSTMAETKTAPALDLDLLLGGFRPLLKVLDPDQVNEISESLVQTLQGQGQTLVSLLSDTSSFTKTIARQDKLIGEVIQNLRSVLGTISRNGDQFTSTVASLQNLVDGLARDRGQIGSAIGQMEAGTDEVAQLLVGARKPLTDTISRLNNLAPLLDRDKGIIDDALQKAPYNYQKATRMGAYGTFFNFYLCGISVRLTGTDGKPWLLPWIKQDTGRCSFDS